MLWFWNKTKFLTSSSIWTFVESVEVIWICDFHLYWVVFNSLQYAMMMNGIKSEFFLSENVHFYDFKFLLDF